MGIEWSKQTEDGLEMFCDCGTITVLTTGEPGEPLPGGDAGKEVGTIYVPANGGEVAFTCHGCGGAHWLIFTEHQPPGGAR